MTSFITDLMDAVALAIFLKIQIIAVGEFHWIEWIDNSTARSFAILRDAFVKACKKLWL